MSSNCLEWITRDLETSFSVLEIISLLVIESKLWHPKSGYVCATHMLHDGRCQRGFGDRVQEGRVTRIRPISRINWGLESSDISLEEQFRNRGLDKILIKTSEHKFRDSENQAICQGHGASSLGTRFPRGIRLFFSCYCYSRPLCSLSMTRDLEFGGIQATWM